MKLLLIPSTLKQILGLTAVGLLTSSVAFATPSYDTFAPLPALIAGGTPSKNVAISTASSGGGTLTLGLSAQQRFFNAAVTDNGAGIFYAGTGQNNGLPPSGSAYQGATWNFDFYIKNTSTLPLTYNIAYGLMSGTVYNFNPLADTDASGYTAGTYQDSQNLLFGTFGGAANGFAGFDPNADATYDFLLTAKDANGGTVAQSGIQVVVGKGSSVPDAGSTYMMLGMAIAGIAGLRRKLAA